MATARRPLLCVRGLWCEYEDFEACVCAALGYLAPVHFYRFYVKSGQLSPCPDTMEYFMV